MTSRPSIPITLAAALMALTTGVHLISGGADVHLPLLASAPDPELALYVSVLWHAVSGTLAASTLALGLAARSPVRHGGVLVLTATLSLIYAALFFVYGLTRLQNLWIAPQWVTFLAIALLALWGGFRARARV